MGSISKYIAQIRRLKRKGSYFFRLAMSALEWVLVNWHYIVGGLLLLIFAYLAYRWWKKRKMTAAASGAEGRPRLSPASLVKVWRTFLDGIPAEFRNSILSYNPFILIGDGGSGKSSLVDHYTDWQGQARQFYPSYTADPQLQIYLGSNLWVQELPPSLLHDTSAEARSALKFLWAPLFRHRPPHVVVTLDISTLQNENPDTLRQLAQMARGKINILSRIVGEPVRVTIALSHMDRVRGFDSFSSFLKTNNIDLELPVPASSDQSTTKCLEAYEEWLGLALTTLTTDEYLQILSFMRHMPEKLELVDSFLRILRNPDPMSFEPNVLRISFCSQTPGNPPLSNPFALPEAIAGLQRDPNRKHRYAALALAAVGAFYFFAGFSYEQSIMSSAMIKIDTLEKVDVSAYGDVNIPQYDEWSQKFSKVVRKTKPHGLASLLPGYLPNHDQFIEGEVHRHYQEVCRQRFLLPKLKGLFGYLQKKSNKARQPNVWRERRRQFWELLGIIFSPCSKEINVIVQTHSDGLSNSLTLPRRLIEDYVNINDEGLEEPFTLPVDIRSIGVGDDPQLGAFEFEQFLAELNSLYGQEVIGVKRHEEVRTEAKSLLQKIAIFERESLANRLYSQLDELLSFSGKENKEKELQTFDAKDRLKAYLRYISDTELVIPQLDKDLDLSQFSRQLEHLNSVLAGMEDEECRFKINEQDYTCRTLGWYSLLHRTRVTTMLHTFRKNNDFGDGLLLFRTSHGFSPLTQNDTNDGHLFFSGKGLVDGRFTGQAFNRIHPVLQELPALMASLPIAKKEKESFSLFVIKEMDAYADRYAKEMTAYYRTFNVRVSSLPELRYVVEQVSRPSSHFQTFLRTVKDNAVFELDSENEFLAPMRKHMAKFDFLGKLLFERKGFYPELEKYLAIIAQLGLDLKVAEPKADEAAAEEEPKKEEKAKGDKAGEEPAKEGEEAPAEGEEEEEEEAIPRLADNLSPAGKYCYDILVRPELSYLGAVERFLDDAHIKPPFRKLFVGPVSEAYRIGRADLRETVDAAWNDIYREYYLPIANTFPFDLKAKETAPPKQIKEAFHARGKVSKLFENLIAPVCSRKAGKWIMRPSTLGALQQPKGMLDMVNSVERFRKRLWNKKGEPKPLVHTIQTSPLPPVVETRPSVVLAYLRSGESSVFAFNQRPRWKKLNVSWWQSASSSAGIRIENPRKRRRSYSAEEVVQSDWSFYRLLHEAEVVGPFSYAWTFNNQQTGYRRYTIKFTAENDPFALFKTIPFKRKPNVGD